MTYLGGSIGATIGASAWNVVPPRFMPWVGFVFVLGALACSMLGERAARRERPDLRRQVTLAAVAVHVLSLDGRVRLDLDLQIGVHAEAEVLAPADAEVLAIDLAGRVRAADFLLLHRMLLAQEAVDLQRHGLRDPVQRQRAFDFGRRAVDELRQLAGVGRGRKLGDVEHLGRARVIVQLVVAEIDR